ncbi:MAG: MSMEG_1061 family FMN-dependent PPOX-type flavoprotein, partial [Chloroflexota bacterium]
CRTFIARSPFALLGSYNAAGGCDVAPRGDAPGFALVLDPRTLVIPERPGNRRLDTLRNIVETGQVGLLFLVPGFGETLRINGRAVLTRDPAILERTAVQGKPPLVAIGVEVDECFLHCAKALKRSKLWEPAAWPPRDALPTFAQMLHDQLALGDTSVAELDAQIQDSYAKRLY